jgi:hypothetical protein
MGLLSGRAGTRDDNKFGRSLQLLDIYLRGESSDSPLTVRVRPAEEFEEFFWAGDPFQPYFFGKPIGASAIIEAQAIFVQEYELDMLGLTLHEFPKFWEPSVSTYYLTQAVWLHFFQGVIFPDPVRSWEYLWALNLALWSPVFPGNTKQVDWSWHDIHPGWRFLKICNALKVSGYGFLSDDADDQDAAAEQTFATDVCDYLDWPIPTDIAKCWIESWKHGISGGLYSEKDERGSLAHPRMRFMLGHFETQCYGKSFEVNNADLCHFPLAVVICDDSWIMLPAGCWGRYDAVTGNRISRFKEYIMYDFAKYWGLGEGIGSYLLRNEIAEFSATMLADLLCRAAGVPIAWSDEIRQIVFKEIQRVRS